MALDTEATKRVLDEAIGEETPADQIADRLAWHQRHPGKEFGDRPYLTSQTEKRERPEPEKS